MTTFRTNPVLLEELLKACASGAIQLPDFQRSWVWDDERIKSLIASISQAFPVGALMSLDTGGEVDFKPRPVEGAQVFRKPDSLLLDGQQRMTSLYQTILRGQVVETVTPRQVKVKRWYYLSIPAALSDATPREEAVIGVPEDRQVRSHFGTLVDLDVSTSEAEYANQMFPVRLIFDSDEWEDGWRDYWEERDRDVEKRFRLFRKQVLENFRKYQVPVITLERDTTKEAVCLVFEKVNTGGKALDAFELVTAMYAANNFELRKDWQERHARLTRHEILKSIGPTEFLQAVSLLHTRAVREEAIAAGRDVPAVSATRQSLLKVPLSAYVQFAPVAEEGFLRAARMLRSLRIYRAYDLPYQSQLTPLAAILGPLTDALWNNTGVREKLHHWYWNGVFGELYGSAIESRFARDVVEVPEWLGGGAAPSTVEQAQLRADRLRTMRSRLSAAYKGVNALLMKEGAEDFRSGQTFDDTVFFDENVDIHHIFPKAWCATRPTPIAPGVYDSIINKTPLSATTNRIIGGDAPSRYLSRLEAGGKLAPPIEPMRLDAHLASHLIDVASLRADDFEGFMAAREAALLRVIERAMGKDAYLGSGRDEAEVDVAPSAETDEEPA